MMTTRQNPREIDKNLLNEMRHFTLAFEHELFSGSQRRIAGEESEGC